MNAFLFRQTALVVCLFCGITALADAQGPSRRYRPPPEYVQLGKPDQEQGKRVLEEFRKSGLYSGNCYFDFEFRVMPRRGPERVVPGQLWVGQNARGPVSRIVLLPGVAGQESRLLVQNGPENAAWGWKPGTNASPARLAPTALFEKLADTDVTIFDLQMPFLYWNDFVFEGVSKVRGRPAYTFLMYPPAEVTAAAPEMTGVRVYMDTQYRQPVQSQVIGVEGKLLKSVTVIDLKIIDKQPIVKSVDFRDETLRNKSRFSVTGAAVGLDFAASIFEPGMLAELIHPPAADQILKMAP